jgi:hypothetical protein
MKTNAKLLRILIISGVLLLTLAICLRLASPARAVEFSHEGNIPAGQVIDDDLFISADNVVMDGIVNGDLFISSSTTVVNGTVNGNLIVNSAQMTMTGQVQGSLVFTGQSAVINGQVSGAVYSTGASLQFGPQAEVGRNVFYAGYSLESKPGSRISRDLLVIGYQTLVHGEVARKLNFAGAALEIGGQVGGDVQASVSAPDANANVLWSLPFFQGAGIDQPAPGGLRVLPSAQVGGALHYSSPVEQTTAIQSQPAGGVTFSAITNTKAPASLSAQAASWVLDTLRELGTLLLLGALAAWLAPGGLRDAAAQLRLHPLPASGWGIVTILAGFLVLPLGALLIVTLGLLIGIIGFTALSVTVYWIGFSVLGVALGIFLVTIAYGSKLVVAQWGGQWLVERFAPARAASRILPLVIGILVYFFLRLIPIVSFLVGLLVTLLGMGALWLAYRAARRLVAPEAARPEAGQP